MNWIVYMSERVNEWVKQRMHEWTNEAMNVWMNVPMKQWNLRTSSSKSVPTLSVFFDFYVTSSSRSVLCTFCRPPLQIEAHTCRNRDPTSATTEATLPEKHRVLRPGVFSSLNSCVPDLFEGSLEVKLPTIWTDEKQSREEAERRERLEERRVEEKK